MSDLAKFIDLTLLKPDASRAQIETLCAEAAEHNFATVCVNGSRVELAHSLVKHQLSIYYCTVTTKDQLTNHQLLLQ